MRHHLPAISRLAGIVFALGLAQGEEAGGRWRVFQVKDGLADRQVLALSFSARGHLWARHDDQRISWFDGYQIRALPGGGAPTAPVYESRSGQLWTLHPEGVMDFRRDQWLLHPISEVGTEIQNNPARVVRPVPLLPGSRDRVLILLPEVLLDFDAGDNSASAVRRAGETGLGRFTDLAEARDGGAWIAGRQGLAKLPGPIRRLTPATEWVESRPDPTWGVRNLERLSEDDEGGVTVIAERNGSSNRVVLHFDGRAWRPPTEAPERVRQAWRGSGDTFWACSRSALYRRDGAEWRMVTVPGMANDRLQIHDVVPESNGAFWLATSEGLVRHAADLWQPAPLAIPGLGPVTGLAEGVAGDWYVAGTNRLRQWQEGRSTDLPLPPGGESSGDVPVRTFHVLADGSLIAAGGGGAHRFQSDTGGWIPLAPGEDLRVRRVVGRSEEGMLFVEVADGGGRTRVDLLGSAGFSALVGWEIGESVGTNLSVVQQGKENLLWIGGERGLASADPRTGRVTAARGFPAGPVRAVLVTSRSRVWCAAEDSLYEFDGRGWSLVRAGLGRIVCLLAGLDGSVWVGSQTGVHRFIDGTWMDHGPAEGLPASDLLQLVQSRRGDLWALTRDGLSRFVPAADQEPPRVEVVAPPGAGEVLSTEVVRLPLRGLDRWDYTPPDRLLFTHRLDDGRWSPYSPVPEVVLSNVPPGPHQIQVRVMDRNWNETAEPAVFEVVSTVPWSREPRVVMVGLLGLIAAGALAWLAVNRHLRLVHSYAEVERMVAVRTRELERANQELIHSQKMRALGTLAAGIAHDFNSILSIIKGSAQIIEANLDDREKVRTRVERIRTGVEQGSALVKAMLGFSRVTEKRRPDCDVNRVLQEASQLVGEQFLGRVRLELHPAEGLPAVEGVAEMIQQMLVNLIINAVEALHGQGTIVVRTGLSEVPPADTVLAPAVAGRHVWISVEDDGPGIAPEILPRIFEPFFTTKALSTRRGTGLGLSMVYEMAKELGYGLSVETGAGRGSVFRILIPVAASGAGGAAPRQGRA